MEQETIITYELVRKKVKHISIRIRPEGRVMVTVPRRVSMAQAEAFVQSKREWILRKLSELEQCRQIPVDELEWNTEKEAYLRALLDQQYEGFAHYHISYPQLKFRRMTSRYGSCNAATGVITLNKALADMPRECAEYVAAHELAHLVHADHSPAFYRVLDEVMPDHRAWERRLRAYRLCRSRGKTGSENTHIGS